MPATIVYCHGLPGFPEEASAFETRPPLVALERLSSETGEYEPALLRAFDALSLQQPVVLVGFSLGAMSALRIAAERPALVERLVLVSPAAPLQLGEFLPDMAGRPVFEAARAGALALGLLSSAQAALTALAPNALIATMFQNCPAAETRLLESPGFIATLRHGLSLCLGPRRRAYHAELRAYVCDWTAVIGASAAPVEIWQGDADTWAPAAMARALAAGIGERCTLRMCAGLGHYSTLQAALAALA